MQIQNVHLEAVGVRFSQYPQSQLPEMALVGRSNVGKSSLINTMINRKALARTSQTPGKTRTINFYNIEDSLYFVDLPGYGYAQVSQSETQRWGEMIDAYLEKRETLTGIIMVVDLRHPPQHADLQMLDWIRHFNRKVIIAGTKLDKIKRSQQAKHIKELSKGFHLLPDEPFIPFSSVTQEGKKELWQAVDFLAGTTIAI